MKKIGALFVLALVLVGGAVRADTDVFVSPVGPPFGAIQLFENTSFEEPEGATGWTLAGDAKINDIDAHTGNFSLHQGGINADSWTGQGFDISRCRPDSDVWIRAAYQILTPIPFPALEEGFDVTEGWFYNNDGISVAHLWQRYDYDRVFTWQDPWIRVTNLPEALNYGLGNFVIASVTNNEPSSRTDFLYDDVELWCMPQSYSTFLPLVQQ